MNEYVVFKLKPMCDAILRDPTVENAKQLSDELARNCNQSNLINPVAQDLILLPILMQVGQLNIRNKNEIKVHLIKAITNLLKCLRIRSLISFKTILMVLLKEIYVEGIHPIRPNLSEEFKLSVIECFEATSRLASSDIIEKFYVNENRNIIAQILYVCVDIISTETYRILRFAAIKCVLSLEYIHDEADFSDVVLRDQIAGIVFILLPKVVVTLKNVALGDEKQGQNLIKLSLKALGRILHLVMEDQECSENCPSGKDIKKLVEKLEQNKMSECSDNEILSIKSSVSAEQSIQDKIRTKEWLQAASRKIKPVIESLHRLIGNKSKQIRDELANFADCLLQHCSRNMSSCIMPLLEIKIALNEDEKSILTLNYTLNEDIIGMIEQIFLAHLIKLPRLIYTGQEDEQTAGFSLLNSLLVALAQTDRMKICLVNGNVLNKMVSVLLASVELDKPNQLLEEEHSIRLIDEESAEDRPLRNSTPWKVFKNLQNEGLVDKIISICQTLSRNGETRDLVLDTLFTSFSTNSSNCNEILVLFQFFVPKAGKKLSSIDSLILDDILTNTHWGLALQATSTTVLKMEELGESRWYEDRTEGLYESAISIRTSDILPKISEEKFKLANSVITLNDVKFNVLHTCLILETVAAYATYLGANFQPYLLNSIHHLLEKSGSSHFVIHSAGVYALKKLKSALNLVSIAELIFQNIDYITFHINKSLRNFEESKSALDILAVVIKHSSLESMPHLESIVTTVLCESAKSYQTKNAISFLRVFHMILLGIQSLTKQAEDQNVLRSREVEPPINNKNHKGWIELLLHKDDLETEITEESEIGTADVEDDNEGVEDEDGPSKDTPMLKPIFLQFTINIMQRCIRYVSSKDRNEKLVALDALCVGLEIIKSYENDLLPMVHSIWVPFAERVRDNDPIILRRCFSLLLILASYAKDFIYHRCTKEVLPFILKFLKENSRKTFQTHQGQSYELSQEFKLLRELLSNLPKILICLRVSEKDLNDTLDATIWLLSSKQQSTLQQHCVNFYKELSEYDKAAVLVKLLKIKDETYYKANVSNILLNFN